MTSLLAAFLCAGGTAWAAENRLPPPPAEPHLEFVADRLDYDQAQAVIHLQGGVRVKESTWTLKGDELWVDTRQRRARSEGPLLLEDGMSAIYGDAGEFDFTDHTGVLYHASAGHGDWRVHAKSMVLDVKRRIEYADADFTSCSYDPKPHYHFHASRMTVIPRRRLFARNVLFVLGPVPVFYTPFLYKSLSKSHFLRFKVQPGYDRRNGAFLKSTLTTDHSPAWRSKLFLDYYSAQGFGVGSELHHRAGEDSRGFLGGYRIRETRAGTERWSVNGDLYQEFLSSFSAQGRLQVMSDPSFNNDYSRSSPFRMTPNLMNSVAVVYRRPQVTTRLSYSREDDAISTYTFVKTYESAPRLDVQSAQLKFWNLPWLNTLSGFADSNYSRGRPYDEKAVGGTWAGTRVFALARGVRFTPAAQYSQTFYNRVDAATDLGTVDTKRGAMVGRYLLAGTLRLSSFVGNLDITQTYARRQKADSLAEDAGAMDHGVETNALSFLHAYRPSRQVLVRLNSGYDFRVYRNQTLTFKDRVQPIISDIIYAPRPTFNLTLRDDYQLASGNRNFIFSGTWGDEERTFLAAGAGYNLADASRYFINTEVGWSDSTGTLHVIAALRSQVDTFGGVGGLHGYKFFEKEITVVKRWHDFFTRLGARFRPGNVQEATVRVEMKFGSFDAERRKVHDWESEWFPERAQGRVDRP